ncbi:MAG TPA: SDR family NAD(P)-dependent oxidoreductase [Sporichthyaceae bacterium]|jgi:NAD(P)-dependent dehydrogenase (short-subunit alcohol dehydrogenase family)|nr:SDR family NAD(P)-dependent oxidoreductase [Sporichthyaceae bacterium]
MTTTRTTPAARSAAITGAGSGLGRAIAIGFADKGYRVFGTARNPEEIEEVQRATHGLAQLANCDITDQEAVRRWAEDTSDALGKTGLDVLVNNAGILTPGPLEVLSIDAVRREFEVNVFGSLAVINAFLPALRRAHGRIVQIGSMTGRLPLPFNGPSSASKAALEAFADVYRGELKPFGVDFVMAQPGNMATGGPAKTEAALKRAAESMTPQQRELYGDTFAAFTAAFNAMQSSGLDAAAAAAGVIEAAERKPAPIRVPIGPDAEEILKLVHEQTDEELDDLRMRLVGLQAQPSGEAQGASR